MRSFYLLCLLTSFVTAAPRIASVNIQQVFSKYSAHLEINANYEKQLRELESNQRYVAIQETEARLQELAGILKNKETSEKDKEDATKEFNALTVDYRSLASDLSDFLSMERIRITQERVEAMEKALQKVQESSKQTALENQLDFLFDISGKTSSQHSPILYLKNATDITLLLENALGLNQVEEKSPSE